MTVTVPAGVLASATPYQMTITASALTPAGCTTTCTTVTHTEYAWLKVSAGGPTFSISANPPRQTVAPGATLQYTVQVTGSPGVSGNVALTATNNAGSVSFNNNGSTSATVAVGGSVTMNVTVSPNTPNGPHGVAITGMLGSVPQRSTVALDVGADGYILEVNSVTGDQQPDGNGNMRAGIPQIVTIGGTGFFPTGDDGWITITPLSGGQCQPSCGSPQTLPWSDTVIQLEDPILFDPGTYRVTVNIAAFEQPYSSTTFTFTVDPALPNGNGISPATASVGQQNLGVTITGTDFGPGVGAVNGVSFTIAGSADPSMTFSQAPATAGCPQATCIQGNLSTAGNAQPGGRGIALTTSLGETVGTPLGFAVTANPVTITQIDPSSFAAGVQGVPVTITGSGFGTNPAISIDG
jgi:hypothetical protein